MTTVATKIHIRNAEGDGVLCGADVPFMETLPARSVQPAGEPDCREWAEDRLAKSMCCPDCLERRDAPMGNAIAMIHQINTATRETLCGLTHSAHTEVGRVHRPAAIGNVRNLPGSATRTETPAMASRAVIALLMRPGWPKRHTPGRAPW